MTAQTRKLRVLRVVPSTSDLLGGPVSLAKMIDAELARTGHHVEVVSLDCEPIGSDYPVRVHYLGPSRGKFAYNAGLAPWIKENSRRFDAVVIDGLWQYTGLGTWLALRSLQIPYYVYAHGMLAPWFKEQHHLKHLKKLAYWVLAERRVLRDAAGVIFMCEEERLAARLSFPGYVCNESTSPPGIAEPPEGFGRELPDFFDRNPHLRGKRLLLFLGRLHPIKGCDVLLSAFANLMRDEQGTSDVHLVFGGVGSEAYELALRDLADSLGIATNVSWLGMLRGEDKWQALRAADVLCLPSHHENFGVVVAEAFACGTPVIISNKVNIWREVAEAGAGIVCNDDVVGVSAALRKWLKLGSEQDSKVLKRAARDCFDARYRVESAARSLVQLIDRGGYA